MSTTGNHDGGCSKDERRFVGCLIPVNQAEHLADLADQEGATVDDMLAAAIEEKLMAHDLKLMSDEQLGHLLGEIGMPLNGTVTQAIAREVVEHIVAANRHLLPSGSIGGAVSHRHL